MAEDDKTKKPEVTNPPKDDVKKEDVKKVDEAKIRAEERDKYIKEINSLKDALKNKDTMGEELTKKIDAIEANYQKEIGEQKNKTFKLFLENSITKMEKEAGISIPVEFVQGVNASSSAEEVQKALEVATQKAKDFLEAAGKKPTPPKSENNKGGEPGLPDLSTYTSTEDIKRDLAKFFKK